MNEPEEQTPRGDPVYRHKAVDRPVELVTLRSAFADKIEAHLEKHIGLAPNVLDEIVSDRIHLDVHVIPPGASRNHFALFTTGMSTRPMKMPNGTNRYAELMIALPWNWPGLENVLRDTHDPEHPWKKEENYWPIRMLKDAARLPHDYNTWLGYGHTISASEQDAPFAPNTRLSTALINLPIGFLEPEAAVLQADPEVQVIFYSLWPLYPEEREFKLHHGADALVDLLESKGIGPVIDPQRPSAVAKRRGKTGGAG